MTIHSEHPFLPPERDRSPLRRLRGRLLAPVTLWTTSHQGRRAGLTVSSVLIADGDPAEVVGLLDPDSDLAELIVRSGTVAVSLLTHADQHLADAFAGLAPAPGGMFRLAEWTETDWGPVPRRALGWIGAQIVATTPEVGWSNLIRAEVRHVELTDGDAAPLAHLRGRYRRLD